MLNIPAPHLIPLGFSGDFLLILSLLPYLCLLATIQLFAVKDDKREYPFLYAAIDGAIVWSVAVWSITNILSFFDRVGPNGFGIFWVAYFIATVWLLYVKRDQLARPVIAFGWPQTIITVILVGTFISALAYPPNNWDVLSYHLPRVIHWMQNGTLAPYPTSIPRQTGMPPFNSMIVLQSMAFGGYDFFVNLGQWLAFAGCIAASAAICGQLGGGNRARWLTALTMATIPAAITQASNTESSDIVTFWLLAIASLTLAWLRARNPRDMLRIGFCLGFAILSKGSAYPVALPFVLIIAWHFFRQPRKLFRQCVLAACLALAINLPHFFRVYEAYGSIVGGTEKNILAKPNLGTFIVNSAYNFLIHEPWLLWQSRIGYWEALAKNLNVDTDDPELYPWGGVRHARTVYLVDEAYGQSPVHAAFLILLLLAIITRFYKPPLPYTLAVAGAFLIYNLILTWHPFAGRLHISLLALASPLCGLFIASWKFSITRIFWVILFCAGASLPLFASQRPLGAPYDNSRHFLNNPRDYLYFNANPGLAEQYIAAANLLANLNPGIVGLDLCDNAFEYPLYALLRERMPNPPKLAHIKSSDGNRPDLIFVQSRNDRDDVNISIIKREGEREIRIFPPNP